MNQDGSFEFEYGEETLVVKLRGQLTSLSDEAIRSNLGGFLDTIRHAGFKNVLIDFEEAKVIGSSLLSVLLNISQTVRQNDGQMAICSVDHNERQVLEVSRFDELWKIFDTREAALAEIGV